MGDNFLRQQVSNAKRRRDRAADGLRRPSLLGRLELVRTSYEVKPLGGHEFAVGDVLYGVAPKKGTHIDVTDGHRRLGCSEGDSAKALRDELSKPGELGVIKMRIVDVGVLSGVAQARIITDGEDR